LGGFNTLYHEERRRKMRKIAWKAFIMFILLGLSIGCLTTPELIQVRMDYTPTNMVEPPKDRPGSTIFISPITDKRKNPDQIGENNENPKVVPAKASAQEVLSSMETAFKKEFTRAGLNVVDSKEKAQRIIDVSLLTLWVAEKNTFDAVVVTHVEVKDKDGRVLDSQGFKGAASRWGTSYSPEEYRKAVSDAVVELLKNMFNNDAFIKSLG
jgi:hypothetical protein